MIYYIIFGRDAREVMDLEGDALGIYLEESLKKAEERALREMSEYGWPFASIFVLNPEPVRLSFLSLEEETIKALRRWF